MPTPLILATAQDAALLFAPRLSGRTRETLLVAHLDAERRLLRLSEEAGGTEHHIDIPVRAIIADAVHLGASGLVLAHCHPSGDPTPSEPDIAATRRLAELAHGLGIALHDHLIFAGAECRSFRALGLL